MKHTPDFSAATTQPPMYGYKKKKKLNLLPEHKPLNGAATRWKIVLDMTQQISDNLYTLFFFFLWIGGGRVHLCNTYNVMCMRLSKTFIVAANICIFSRNTSDLNISCVVSRLSCSPLSNADDKKNMIWDYVKHLEHCTAYVSKFYLCSDYLDIFFDEFMWYRKI